MVSGTTITDSISDHDECDRDNAETKDGGYLDFKQGSCWEVKSEPVVEHDANNLATETDSDEVPQTKVKSESVVNKDANNLATETDSDEVPQTKVKSESVVNNDANNLAIETDSDEVPQTKMKSESFVNKDANNLAIETDSDEVPQTKVKSESVVNNDANNLATETDSDEIPQNKVKSESVVNNDANNLATETASDEIPQNKVKSDTVIEECPSFNGSECVQRSSVKSEEFPSYNQSSDDLDIFRRVKSEPLSAASIDVGVSQWKPDCLISVDNERNSNLSASPSAGEIPTKSSHLELHKPSRLVCGSESMEIARTKDNFSTTECSTKFVKNIVISDSILDKSSYSESCRSQSVSDRTSHSIASGSLQSVADEPSSSCPSQSVTSGTLPSFPSQPGESQSVSDVPLPSCTLQLIGDRSSRSIAEHNESPKSVADESSTSCPAQLFGEVSSESVVNGSSPSCSICGKQFYSVRYIEEHMRTHTGEKPFRCAVCGRGFSLSQNLSKHTRIHTGEKKYSCPHCGKLFRDSQSMKRHTRIHTGEMPYQCAVCSESFRYREMYINHMKEHSFYVTQPRRGRPSAKAAKDRQSSQAITSDLNTKGSDTELAKSQQGETHSASFSDGDKQFGSKENDFDVTQPQQGRSHSFNDDCKPFERKAVADDLNIKGNYNNVSQPQQKSSHTASNDGGKLYENKAADDDLKTSGHYDDIPLFKKRLNSTVNNNGKQFENKFIASDGDTKRISLNVSVNNHLTDTSQNVLRPGSTNALEANKKDARRKNNRGTKKHGKRKRKPSDDSSLKKTNNISSQHDMSYVNTLNYMQQSRLQLWAAWQHHLLYYNQVGISPDVALNLSTSKTQVDGHSNTNAASLNSLNSNQNVTKTKKMPSVMLNITSATDSVMEKDVPLNLTSSCVSTVNENSTVSKTNVALDLTISSSGHEITTATRTASSASCEGQNTDRDFKNKFSCHAEYPSLFTEAKHIDVTDYKSFSNYRRPLTYASDKRLNLDVAKLSVRTTVEQSINNSSVALDLANKFDAGRKERPMPYKDSPSFDSIQSEVSTVTLTASPTSSRGEQKPDAYFKNEISSHVGRKERPIHYKDFPSFNCVPSEVLPEHYPDCNYGQISSCLVSSSSFIQTTEKKYGVSSYSSVPGSTSTKRKSTKDLDVPSPFEGRNVDVLVSSDLSDSEVSRLKAVPQDFKTMSTAANCNHISSFQPPQSRDRQHNIITSVFDVSKPASLDLTHDALESSRNDVTPLSKTPNEYLQSSENIYDVSSQNNSVIEKHNLPKGVSGELLSTGSFDCQSRNNISRNKDCQVLGVNVPQDLDSSFQDLFGVTKRKIHINSATLNVTPNLEVDVAKDTQNSELHVISENTENSQVVISKKAQVCDIIMCNVCGKKMRGRSYLQVHMRSHTGERPHQCGVCGQGFAVVQNMYKHMRIHTGERRFSCSYCGRHFRDSQSRNRHVRLHTGEKPFKCHDCGEMFLYKNKLVNHRKVCLSQDVTEISSSKDVTEKVTSRELPHKSSDAIISRKSKNRTDPLKSRNQNDRQKSICKTFPVHHLQDVIETFSSEHVTDKVTSRDVLHKSSDTITPLKSKNRTAPLKSRNQNDPQRSFCKTFPVRHPQDIESFISKDVTEELTRGVPHKPSGTINPLRSKNRTDPLKSRNQSDPQKSICKTFPLKPSNQFDPLKSNSQKFPQTYDNLDVTQEFRSKNISQKFSNSERSNKFNIHEIPSECGEKQSRLITGCESLGSSNMKIYSSKDLTCDKNFQVISKGQGVAQIAGEQEEDQICRECGEVFHSVSELKSHMLIHIEEAAFQCDVCDEMFIEGHNFKIHMDMHKNRPRERTCES